jgi:hypothetical protein
MNQRASFWRGALGVEARRLARDEAPLVIIVALYLAAGWLADVAFGLDVTRRLTVSSLASAAGLSLLVTAIFVASYLIVFAIKYALEPRVRGEPDSSGGAATSWSAIWRTDLRPSRVAGLFVAYFALVTFMDAFLGFKAAIPAIQPFGWDRALMGLDRALHFGHHPWQLLQPILGHAPLTKAVDSLYYAWFAVFALTLVWQAWSRERRLRAQFFVSYAAMWIILGTVAAAALSSAGPCYYGRVVGAPDPFAPLMGYLSGVNERYPLIALRVQSYLWDGYTSPTAGAFAGISAMPSLHVAMPVLFALLGWRTHRWLGIAYTTYGFIVLLGSVHLGWHYAVDGYASILAMPLIWKGSGAAVAWYYRAVGGRAEGPGPVAASES